MAKGIVNDVFTVRGGSTRGIDPETKATFEQVPNDSLFPQTGGRAKKLSAGLGRSATDSGAARPAADRLTPSLPGAAAATPR